MQNKLKITAVLSTLIFALIPLFYNTANAMTFDMSIPSFGLYCNNAAVLQGNVKYVIDENGKAVQYSEYTVNDGTFYIPFISSSFNIPEIDINSESEICYGSPIGLGNKYDYDFYSSDLNGMAGTIYTLNTTSESFTVNFSMLENQVCICRFTQGSRVIRDGKQFAYTVKNAQTDIPYEVFILNGDCTKFESSAEITKEAVTVKEYIDRQFNELKDYLSVGEFTPTADMLYALANQAVATNINYDYFDFFIDSFAQMRLNAYKIEVKAPCAVSYSMSVDVQKNSRFTPAIYKTDQTITGNYAVNYTIELNSELPYVLESSADVKKLNDYSYTANNVTDDFYFIFSSSKKPKSIYGDNNKIEPWRIALYVLLGVCVCAFIVLITIWFISFMKSKRQSKADK